MERIGNILDNPVTSPGGPSPDSTNNPWINGHREQRTCETCGDLYDGWVFPNHPTTPLCRTCRDAAIRAAAIRRAEAGLAEADKEQRARWYEQCGMHRAQTLANFERSMQPKAYDAIKNYKGGSLVLASEVYGNGKTHLVAALVNRLLSERPAAYVDRQGRIVKNQCPAFFITEGQLLGSIRATYNSKGLSEEDVYQDLAGFPLLVIDDIGKVKPKDTCFLQGVLYRVIDDRYNRKQDVVLTTNLSFSGLEDHLGGAIADRLREMCGERMIKMGGKSYRKGGAQ